MAKKGRTIAGFDDVAKRDENNKNNPNINVNNNENSNKKNNEKSNDKANENIDHNENIDSIDKIINENQKKDKTHILKGIYFEREVAAAIDRLGRKGGRGIRSQVVNEAVKKVFKEKGWME